MNERDRRNELTIKNGGKAGMSYEDQKATAQGASLGGGQLPGQTNASPRARLTSPVASPMPQIGNLDANRPGALQAGATAASPVTRTPAATRFVAPAPLTGPTGNRATDAAALGQNLAIAQNPTAFQASSSAPQAAPQAAAVNPTMGRVLTEQQGNAIFGAPPSLAGTGQPIVTPHGVVSSRTAKAGEALPPAVTTADGVSRAAPPNADQQRAALFAKHPAIFKAGTPENLAFVAHAQQHGLEAAHANADSIVGQIAAAKPENQAPNRAMADASAAGNVPAAPTGPEMPRDTFPTAPPALPTQANRVGHAVAGGIKGAVSGVLGDIDRGIVSPVQNFVRGGIDVAKGLVGNTTPTPRYRPMQERTPNPTATPPAQIASRPTPQVGPEPTFQQGDAKWSGKSAVPGHAASVPIGGSATPSRSRDARTNDVFMSKLDTDSTRDQGQEWQATTNPEYFTGGNPLGPMHTTGYQTPDEKFVREPQITFQQPNVPPAQSPPVSSDVDQQKLKKKAKNPTL